MIYKTNFKIQPPKKDENSKKTSLLFFATVLILGLSETQAQSGQIQGTSTTPGILYHNLKSGFVIGGSTTPQPIDSRSNFFTNKTPILEIKGSEWASNFQDLIVMRAFTGGPPNPNTASRLGLLFKFQQETISTTGTEYLRMAGIMAESNGDWGTKVSLHFLTYDQKRMSILENGRVGIGTTAPESQLEIAHDINHGGLILNRLNPTMAKSQISFRQNGAEKWALGINSNQDSNNDFFIYGGTTPSMKFYINPNGNVGIGTTITEEKLNVSGNVAITGKLWVTDEIIVQTTDPWPDYVFDKKYKLNPLCELEKFIKENNHLPNIPSAGEVAEEGVSLAKMNVILVQKIEELTLYIIEQEKRIQLLEQHK